MPDFFGFSNFRKFPLWVNISASDEAGYHRHKSRYNGITSTSEATGYELDGAGLT